MSQPPALRPPLTDRAEAERQARLAREAAALRENLRRRKQQSRAREDEAGEPPAPVPPAASGIS